MTKRKFSKLMNKEVEYTAIKTSYSKEYDKVLLKDIKYNGKLYADHAWINSHHALEKIEFKSKMKFLATGTMYNDKFNQRKQGLTKCRQFETVDHTYEKDIKQNQERKLQTNIRKGYK